MIPQSAANNRGWTVTFAGTGINLALGILYAWSLFKGAIAEEFGWKGSQLNDPYALCCIVFAFTMILAGRCQDKFGPRLTASIGGLLVGAGFVIASTTASYGMWLLGFGLLAGMGIGFGYSSATPPALKWFPPSKTGLIAGLVVAGFGLAPVYLAPTSHYLLGHYQVQKSMLILGIAFVVIVCGLAQLLKNPPAGYVAGAAAGAPGAAKPAAAVNASPGEIVRTSRFWVLWLIYFIGSGAGLMVISSVSGMAKKSMGEAAFIAVAVMAIGNAAGRIGAGSLSDKIGRRWTLMLVLLFQAVLMLVAIPVTASTENAKYVIVLVAALIGANYGANLSLFPSFTKDLWGLKNFGMNYGVLFTAWGVGGFALSRLSQMLYEASKDAAGKGSYQSSFITATALLIVGAALTLLIKPQPKNSAAMPEPAPAKK
jgi:MFS transporter, OFA family, oxalate/formate antiporter